MSSLDFWNARAQRFGHTGWADAATYAYDQGLRLKAVGQVLDGLALQRRHRSLDFGCGSGDFAAMLAARFDAVAAYDIASEVLMRAQQRVQKTNVSFHDSHLTLWTSGAYDLILSITVLQHILDDNELSTLIAEFKAGLAAEGHVVVLETLTPQAAGTGGYLKGRTEAQLCAAFGMHGLALFSSYSFHHPSQAPTRGFEHYRRRLDVRLLGRLARTKLAWAQYRLDAVAQRMLACDDDALSPGTIGPTRILVFSHAVATCNG